MRVHTHIPVHQHMHSGEKLPSYKKQVPKLVLVQTRISPLGKHRKEPRNKNMVQRMK